MYDEETSPGEETPDDKTIRDTSIRIAFTVIANLHDYMTK